MAFSDEDKERVRQATNIIDLIGAVTTIRRSGRNYMAICPFHQEKSASLSIDVARGLYYCHGCHAKGDMFTFVQETQGLNFTESLEFLAGQAGITLTEDPAATRRRGRRLQLIEAVRLSLEFYHRRLMKSADAGHARAYLRSRGYGSDVVEGFKLGYAPGEGAALVKELKASGVDERVMIDAGLARKGRSGMYDEFRDRAMFPIYDVKGDPVGFGGRILGDGRPKYLNTPETELYKKSRLLYGLDRARAHIGKLGYAVVVEGYTDVIALHRAGLPVAVATCGTALGEEHFDLLRRWTDRIVLAFDADAAGAGAALRGETLETPVRLDLDLRVADMPPGVDPADLVQRGDIEVLRTAVEKARPLLQFWLEKELDRFDAREPEGRARAVRAVGPRLAKVEDDIARTEYERFVAARLGVDIATVEQAVGRRNRYRHDDSRPSKSGSSRSPRRRAEEELLRSLLADAGAVGRLGVEAGIFGSDETRRAFEILADQARDVDDGAPVPLPPEGEPAAELLLRLGLDGRPLSPPAELLTRVRIVKIESEIKEMQAKLAAMDPDEQASSPIFTDLLRLQSERRRLEGGS
jgi:DNA primase